MTSVRQLRTQAAAAHKAARKACAAAAKEARIISKTRCELVKASELKLAIKHCKQVEANAELVRQAYVRARVKPSEARKRGRVKASEKKEGARRDAIAAVKTELKLPERVAEIAVRAVERKGRLPAGKERWKALRDRVGGQQVTEAWKRYEREQEREIKKQLAAETKAGNARRKPPTKRKPPKYTRAQIAKEQKRAAAGLVAEQLGHGYEDFEIREVIEVDVPF